ncbi:MAG: hypothetical protein ABT11_13120 [Novosphingobium sp. SCN 66-18]|nr:MAG: hypothetical protein ABT11_13120 [Novosphingobium sp. SCN 66-18]
MPQEKRAYIFTKLIFIIVNIFLNEFGGFALASCGACNMSPAVFPLIKFDRVHSNIAGQIILTLIRRTYACR